MAYKFDENGKIISGNATGVDSNTNSTIKNIIGSSNGSISSSDIKVDNTRYTFDNNGRIVGYNGNSAISNIVGKSKVVPTQDSNENAKTDDDGASKKIVNTSLQGSALVTKPTSSKYSGKSGASPNYYTADYFQNIMHYSGLYQRTQLNTFTKTHRFGNMNPYGALSTGREFLFFTKPDLHIIERSDSGIITNTLNPALANIPFWIDLFTYRKHAIALLQNSYEPPGTNMKKADPFNHLFQNNCISNLEIQALSAEMIDTPQNIYGVGFKYRGSSEASDDGPEFSLEFKDNRWLDVYSVFKAYEEYETLKHHGVIRPYIYYITNKIIHDQIAIYKFIVDEDMESIIYYGKMYGVVPKSLPRDVFGNPNFDNGLSYSIDFSAAFYEDMNPNIIADFNALSKPWYDSCKYEIGIYNQDLDRVDRRAALAAYIVKDTESKTAQRSTTGYVYKLKWKGNDTV